MDAISKAEYLKRYLSKDEQPKEEKKKKRRKIKQTKDSKLRIIDDDVDFKKLKAGATDDEVNDDAPIVTEIIDERPKHVQQLELYRKNASWKVLGEGDEDDTSALEYGVIKVNSGKDTEAEKGRPNQARKRHDSDGSDPSPPRMKLASSDQAGGTQGSTQNRKAQRHSSDSPTLKDDSAINNRQTKGQRNQRLELDRDSDASPPRQTHSKNHSKTSVPPRPHTSTIMEVMNTSDSDHSPPRRRQGRHDSDSDQSSVRKQRAISDSDQSPVRKRRASSDSDQSPPKKNKARSAAGQSSPRKGKAGSDSDPSPPRKKRHDSNSNQSPTRKKSVPNRGLAESDHRKKNSPVGSSKSLKSSRFEREQEEGKKATKTLGGAKAGLSSAKEMREEAKKLKAKEERSFQNIDSESLGRHAKTVVRDKETGKRKDLKAEEAQNEEEAKRLEELNKKYQQWGKGLKQLAVHEAQLKDQVYEASKPLARYEDDKDLDDMLRKEERAEDPMLAFIKSKKKIEDEKSGKKKKTEYTGPAPPPNRFNIQPGHRWDGVDRSNGFEKKIFAQQANKKAVEEIAYKWSTEDM